MMHIVILLDNKEIQLTFSMEKELFRLFVYISLFIYGGLIKMFHIE